MSKKPKRKTNAQRKKSPLGYWGQHAYDTLQQDHYELKTACEEFIRANGGSRGADNMVEVPYFRLRALLEFIETNDRHFQNLLKIQKVMSEIRLPDGH